MQRIIAAAGNDAEMLLLIRQFDPLLQKYSRKLSYEDAYPDLRYEFIRLIYYIAANKRDMMQEKYIVRYIEQSIIHTYCRLLRGKMRVSQDILFSGMTEEEQYCLDGVLASQDTYEQLLMEELKSLLTEKEYYVIYKTVIQGGSSVDVARECGVSKQSINQTKHGGLLSQRKE